MMDKWCCVGNDVTIGYEGENNAREIRFGLGKWRQAWPTAVPRMVIERETDSEGGKESYIAVTEMDGDTMVWKVKRYDLKHPGWMKMWIVFVDEGEEIVGMTQATQINVLDGPDMIDGETPPEMAPPWMVDVIAAANRIDQTAAEIPQTIEAALKAAKDSGEFDGPPGEKGEPGYTPTLKVERVEDGVNVTATNADGEETAKVYDGSKNVFIAKPGMLPAEIIAEAEKGKACFTVGLDGALYAYVGMEYVPGEGKEMLAFRRALKYEHDKLSERTVFINEDGRHYTYGPSERKIVNPEKLFVKKDGKTYAYDGSARLTVEIPSAGSGLPEPEGPHMQLVTDSDGNWTQEERLAYKTTAIEEVLQETTVSGEAHQEWPIESFVTKPVVGGKYTVTWNGVDYECTGTAQEMDGIVFTMLYAEGACGIIVMPDEYAETAGVHAIVQPEDDSTTATLKIVGEVETARKMVAVEYLGTPNGDMKHKQLVTDATGVTAWEDRLAYTYVATTDNLPFQMLTVDADMGAAVLPEPLGLIAGGSYEVWYSGTIYERTALAFVDGDTTAVFIGNPAFMGGDDNGDPFAVMEVGGDDPLSAFVSLEGKESFTASITGPKEMAKQVDKKYLPNYNVKPLEVSVGNVGGGYAVTNGVTLDELMGAVNEERDLLLTITVSGVTNTQRLKTSRSFSSDLRVIGYHENVSSNGHEVIYYDFGQLANGSVVVLSYRETTSVESMI